MMHVDKAVPDAAVLFTEQEPADFTPASVLGQAGIAGRFVAFISVDKYLRDRSFKIFSVFRKSLRIHRSFVDLFAPECWRKVCPESIFCDSQFSIREQVAKFRRENDRLNR